MRRRVVQWLGLVMLLAAVFCNTAACGREDAPEVIPGVRLGMTPRDVRDRFEGGAVGTWQTRVGAGAGASDDTIVEWTASTERSRATTVRFEFHLGMLVAIRAHLRDAVTAQRVDTTPKTVTVRAPTPGGAAGSDVVVLSRDCPTHHEEAESLAAKAPK